MQTAAERDHPLSLKEQQERAVMHLREALHVRALVMEWLREGKERVALQDLLVLARRKAKEDSGADL